MEKKILDNNDTINAISESSDKNVTESNSDNKKYFREIIVHNNDIFECHNPSPKVQGDGRNNDQNNVIHCFDKPSSQNEIISPEEIDLINNLADVKNNIQQLSLQNEVQIEEEIDLLDAKTKFNTQSPQNEASLPEEISHFNNQANVKNCFQHIALGSSCPPYKDPMRDSLMSDSDGGEIDQGDEGDDDDGKETIIDEDVQSLVGAIDKSLDLELDLWEGQFAFTSAPCVDNVDYPYAVNTHNGLSYYRDIVRSVQMLQQQMGVLADNQINSDDRFSRVKQDNGALQARVVMLEEQLREVEMRASERLEEEQRRNKELIQRIEREKSLTVENYAIKQANLEKEKTMIETEAAKHKKQLDLLIKEKSELEDRVSEAEFTASALTQENAKMADIVRKEKEEIKVERERSSQVIEELRCEVERLRVVEESSRKRSHSIEPQQTSSVELQALQANLQQVKEENKNLHEQIEDLQAQLLTSHLEEGRNLVSSTNNNSLAAEFEAMSNDEGAQYGSDTVEKLKNSLKESQEANQHLRLYIDGILLNIVENYPQLLEVKQQKP